MSIHQKKDRVKIKKDTNIGSIVSKYEVKVPFWDYCGVLKPLLNLEKFEMNEPNHSTIHTINA